jgi:hypothetical protein
MEGTEYADHMMSDEDLTLPTELQLVWPRRAVKIEGIPFSTANDDVASIREFSN